MDNVYTIVKPTSNVWMEYVKVPKLHALQILVKLYKMDYV